MQADESGVYPEHRAQRTRILKRGYVNVPGRKFAKYVFLDDSAKKRRTKR